MEVQSFWNSGSVAGRAEKEAATRRASCAGGGRNAGKGTTFARGDQTETSAYGLCSLRLSGGNQIRFLLGLRTSAIIQGRVPSYSSGRVQRHDAIGHSLER